MELTAAAQTAAGLVARSLAAADVTPDLPETRAVNRRFLYDAGRDLVLRGEGVWRIEVRGARLDLRRAASWDVYGPVDHREWTYRLLLPGPDRQETVYELEPGVVHAKWGESLNEPDRGRSPFELALSSARLLAGIEGQLANEAIAGSALLIPAPIAGAEDDEVTKLTEDIKTADGSPVLVPTGAGGSYEDAGSSGGMASDWKQRRIGIDPTQELVRLRQDAGHDLLTAAGIPVELARAGSTTSAAREAFRRFLHSTLRPIAGILEDELREKLHPEIRLDLTPVSAADVSGRARAFQSMVGGGMEVERAARLSGLLEADEE